MSVRHLEVEVRPTQSGAVLDLHGEINGFSEEALDTAYQQAEATNPEAIILNFEDVDYINSTGIALIVSLLRKARASERHFLAYGLSDHYFEIFEITRLSDFMGIYPDEQSALSGASVS